MNKMLACLSLVFAILIGYGLTLQEESNKRGGLSPMLIGGVAFVLIVIVALCAIPSEAKTSDGQCPSCGGCRDSGAARGRIIPPQGGSGCCPPKQEQNR